jgi:hypothetical protein
LLSGLYNGGPAAIIYGIILSTVGNLAIACSLAELASLYVSVTDRHVLILTLRLTDIQLQVLNITGAISSPLVVVDSSVSSKVSA